MTNFYEALRVIALRDVLLGTPDYQLRWVQRWYSRTFHTPLPMVEELTEDHLYQTFYECQYEIMSDSDDFVSDLAKEKRELLENEDQRAARIVQEKEMRADDVAFAKQREIAMEQERKQREIKRQRQLDKLGEMDALEAAPKVLPKQTHEPIRVDPKLDAGPKYQAPAKPAFGAPPPLTPGIEMQFTQISKEEMEKLLEEPSDSADNLEGAPLQLEKP